MKSSKWEKGFFSLAFPFLFSPLKSSPKIAERKEVKTHDMTLQKIAKRGKKQSISPKWKRGNLWDIFIVKQQFSVFPVFFDRYTSSCNNDLLCLPYDDIAVIMYNTLLNRQIIFPYKYQIVLNRQTTSSF
jgi:hypothetical protein